MKSHIGARYGVLHHSKMAMQYWALHLRLGEETGMEAHTFITSRDRSRQWVGRGKRVRARASYVGGGDTPMVVRTASLAKKPFT